MFSIFSDIQYIELTYKRYEMIFVDLYESTALLRTTNPLYGRYFYSCYVKQMLLFSWRT